jgi:class 3 adenylate cyclase
MEPSIRYAKSADGVSIAYWTCGEGPALVMTPYHSFSHIGLEWQQQQQRPILERLAANCKLVRYDRRGTGLSERRMELTSETEALDLEAVVNAIGDEHIVLFGRGFSGPAAIRYTADHPDQVKDLLLYDTATSIAELMSEPYMQGQVAVMNALLHKDYDTMIDLVLRMMPKLDPEWMVRFVFAGLEPKYLELALVAANDASALVSSIRCPSLVIAERSIDQDVGRSARLASQLANAELVVIDRWPDDPWPDWPDVSEHVYRFLRLDPPPPAPAAPSAFRTILFTDLVGHTEMMQRLGDDKGRDVLREHERITRETLKQYAGAEVKTMGDGFMASFGSVTKAMDCAIALQRAFATHTESMPEPLHVRVGLNAGEPIEEDGDLFGSTVILASRIAAMAGAGEILIPEPLRHLLSGKSYVYSDRGETALKGFEDAVRLYEVRWQT